MTFGVADALRWQRDAACLDYPQEWWFPNRRPGIGEQAKQVCRGCLVRVECLAFALGRNEDHGIWGGYAVREIDHMKRQCCKRCGRKIAPEQAAALVVAGGNLGNWKCRQCFYREIQDRKRV